MSPVRREHSAQTIASPFLKWPGGKRLLVRQLLRLIPSTFNRYYEPFVGGGALFFGLQPGRALLADSNADLIECYEQVRDNCDDVIRELGRLANSERQYYRIREANPKRPAARAARFIYLIKLAFNGIYRVNRATGRFNVPYGHRARMTVFEEEQLRSASRILQSADTMAADFETAVKPAQRGDVVYLDPPYTLAHTHNGFVRYNTHLFSWADQRRLADCAATLAAGGIAVIVTNAPHRSILKLYPGFDRMRLRRPSQIAADASFRGPVTELVLMANISASQLR